MTNVVVVESPAKAKTINKYLGNNYTVVASFGHVRDLPPKDGSVRPEEGFAMDWTADERGSRQLAAIAKAVKGARTLYLATDPDREGEAISWHVRAMLEEKKALRGVDVHRITFNEITKAAVTHAIAHPRDLDQPLIEAYLARRALDYLVGFTLSPVLWRKLPGSRSAGRVQSVALRLVCEREAGRALKRDRRYSARSGRARVRALDKGQTQEREARAAHARRRATSRRRTHAREHHGRARCRDGRGPDNRRRRHRPLGQNAQPLRHRTAGRARIFRRHLAHAARRRRLSRRGLDGGDG